MIYHPGLTHHRVQCQAGTISRTTLVTNVILDHGVLIDTGPTAHLHAESGRTAIMHGSGKEGLLRSSATFVGSYISTGHCHRGVLHITAQSLSVIIRRRSFRVGIYRYHVNTAHSISQVRTRDPGHVVTSAGTSQSTISLHPS